MQNDLRNAPRMLRDNLSDSVDWQLSGAAHEPPLAAPPPPPMHTCA